MRNIKFSSLSPKNVARNSKLVMEFQEKRVFNPPKYTSENHLGLKDYRFLPRKSQGADISGPLGGLSSRRYDHNTEMKASPILGSSSANSRSCLANNVGLPRERPSEISGHGMSIRKLPGICSNKGSLLGVDSCSSVSQIVSGLPLLPPNRYSYGGLDKIRSIGVPNSKNNELELNTGFSDGRFDIHVKDTQSCRKRPLEQVYKRNSDQDSLYEDEEFHDAISDDDDNSSFGVEFSVSKKSSIIPPSKKIYNQTPSTQAQTTGVIGTRANTPNRPSNTYSLPLSLIEDDFKSEGTYGCNIAADKAQNSQKQFSSLELTQYSHPYNFPKTIPECSTLNKESNTDSGDNKHHLSTQRIRTPLRYRSTLIGAMTSKPSSCRILSAAEMKRIFCKSRKPIGSLKDFVHTIDTQDCFNHENNSSLESKCVSESAVISGTVINEGDDPTEDNQHEGLSEKDSSNKSPVSGTGIIETTNTDSSAIKRNEHLSFDYKNKSTQESACSECANLIQVSEKIANSDSSKEKNSLDCNEIKENSSNLSSRHALDDECTLDVISQETVPKEDSIELEKQSSHSDAKGDTGSDSERAKETCETKEVPWWLVNVNKPNQVGIDNEGVFLSDGEGDSSGNEKKLSSVAAEASNSSPSLFTSQGVCGVNNPNSSIPPLFSFTRNPDAADNSLSQTKNKDSAFGGLLDGNPQQQTDVPDSDGTTSKTTFLSKPAEINVGSDGNNANNETAADYNIGVSNKRDFTEKVNLFQTLFTGNTVGSGESLFGITPNTKNSDTKGVFSDICSTKSVTTSVLGSSTTGNRVETQEIESSSLKDNKPAEKDQINKQKDGIFDFNGDNSTNTTACSLLDPTKTTIKVSFEQKPQNSGNSGLFESSNFNGSSSTGIFSSTGLFGNSSNANSNKVPSFGSTNLGGEKGGMTETSSIFGASGLALSTNLFGNAPSGNTDKSDISLTNTNPKLNNDLFGGSVFSSQSSSSSNSFPGTSIFGATGLGVGTNVPATETTNSIFNSQNQGGSLFGMSNANGPGGSLLGMQTLSSNSQSDSSATIQFLGATNQANTGLNQSFQIPQNPTNLFPQFPIFGNVNNISQTPFVFGSNNNVSNSKDELNNNQNANQNNLGSTPSSLPSSSLFGVPGGIFGSTAKPESNIFGLGSLSQEVPFEQRTQQEIAVKPNNQAQTLGLFNSNPSNLLGPSQVIPGSNSNPFIGHSSAQSGNSTHRRRIARAKRSH